MMNESNPLETGGDENHKLYQCLRCNKNYKTKKILRHHTIAVHETKRFSCSVCGRVFRWQTTMDNHQTNCRKWKRRFRCFRCEKMFQCKTNMQRHMEAIHDKVRWKCPACDKSYTQRSNMRTHLKKFHINRSYYNNEISSSHRNQSESTSVSSCADTSSSAPSCLTFNTTSLTDNSVVSNVITEEDNMYDDQVRDPLDSSTMQEKNGIELHKKRRKSYLVFGCRKIDSVCSRCRCRHRRRRRKAFRPYRCSECHQKFFTQRGLSLHSQLHHNPRLSHDPYVPVKVLKSLDPLIYDYKCVLCAEVVESETAFHDHVILHMECS